jgi:hypothetical protein
MNKCNDSVTQPPAAGAPKGEVAAHNYSIAAVADNGAFIRCKDSATLEQSLRACNSHAGLVAALEHARKLISSRDVVMDRAALKMYDAELAKAKGGAE